MPRSSPVPDITTLFWDIGGVVLTNGWDRHARRDAATHFGFDWDEFQDRHDLAFPAFDAGNTSLDEYLNRTLFYRHRDFTREQFVDFMYAQSKACPGMIELFAQLKVRHRLKIVALSNEARELNDYRIEQFGFTGYFDFFFSSCYVGLRKPAPRIYQLALDVLQCEPGEVIFIDDRQGNADAAASLGIHTIKYEGSEQLAQALSRFEIHVGKTT